MELRGRDRAEAGRLLGALMRAAALSRPASIASDRAETGDVAADLPSGHNPIGKPSAGEGGGEEA